MPGGPGLGSVVESAGQEYPPLYPPHPHYPGYYTTPPGPVLINPPHLPTYNYGIPPSPLLYHSQPALQETVLAST